MPQGVSQEPNLAKIGKSRLLFKVIISFRTSKRLGSYFGPATREPGATSRRNQQIAVTLSKPLEAPIIISAYPLTPASQGVSQEPNLAEMKKKRGYFF